MYSSRQLPRRLPRRHGFRSRALLFRLPNARLIIQRHHVLCTAVLSMPGPLSLAHNRCSHMSMVGGSQQCSIRCAKPVLGSAAAPAWQRRAQSQCPADWRAPAHRAPRAAPPRMPRPRAQSRPAQLQPALPGSAPAARQQQACCESCKRTAHCKHMRFRGSTQTHLMSNSHLACFLNS